MISAKNPILVDYFHGDYVESQHRACVIVMNLQGKTELCLGDQQQMLCIRSALKPLQALVLLESGAYDAFSLSAEELALACGSHDAEQFHIDTAINWLDKIGLPESALLCGGDLPANTESMKRVLRESIPVSPAFNGCSGKHVGFLTVAQHLNAKIEGYCDINHPVQQQVMTCITKRAEINPADVYLNTDYCNAPNLFMPFSAFAKAYVSMLNDFQYDTNSNSAKLLSAMMQYPDHVGGTSQYCSRCMRVNQSKLAAKCGAEGVMLSLLPKEGLVVLLKVDDGANRAAEVLMTAILQELGLISQDEAEEMSDDLIRTVRSSTGEAIGRLSVNKNGLLHA